MQHEGPAHDERERLEAALRESERRASFLAEASRILASSLDYETTLRNVAALAVPEMADWCGVDLLEDGAIRRVAVEHPDPEKVALVQRMAERYPADPESPVGAAQVIRTGESQLAAYIPGHVLEAAARDEEHLRLLRDLGLRSYVISPLVGHDRVLGAVTFVFAESGRVYRAEDLALVEDLARRAGTAIDNARLVREITEAREQAEEAALELETQAAEMEEQASELEAMNQQVGAAEARLRAIVDSALDAIVTIDADSIVTGWNGRAEEIFGWSAEEAVGRKLPEILIPPRYREAHRAGMERYLATGEGPILNRRIEITALRRDGREFPVELTVAPIRSESGMGFSAFIRDITERTEADRRLAAEHAVTRVLAESRTLDSAAPGILEAIGGPLGWEAGLFWEVDDAGNVLRVVGTWAASDSAAATFVEAKRQTAFAPGDGLPGRVWQSGEPAWIMDAARDPAYPRAADAAAAGLHGAFAFPIHSGKDRLGVIEFFHREVLAPDEGLLTAVDAIGGDIGESVRRVQAEEERDRALESVQRTAAERDAVLRQITEGVIVADPEGRIVFVNEAARALHGVSELGTPVEDYSRTYHLFTMTGDPYPSEELPLARAVRRGETVRRAEFRIRRADGTEAEVEGSATPVVGADGERLGAVLTLRDVTEQLRSRRLVQDQAAELELHTEQLQDQVTQLEETHAELEMTNEELAASRREAEGARAIAEEANRAKSHFLANMSHELRTPINAIVGYTDLLSMGVTGPVTEEQQAQLERIRASSRHLMMLIEDVLDLSKIEAGGVQVARERARIRDQVSSAISLVEPQAAAKGLRITDRCRREADHFFIGDDDRVRQILANLLSNAVKFTDSEGTIGVSCAVVERGEPGAHLPGPGPWLAVRVEDSGIGISAAQLPAVFEPFVQVETNRARARGGAGLGLTISRQLARLMRGDLTVRSEPGKGSCFTLYLPTEPAGEEAA